MGEDSKSLNIVYHIYFFKCNVTFLVNQGTSGKIFLLHVSISASSHTKLADEQYLKLDM